MKDYKFPLTYQLFQFYTKNHYYQAELTLSFHIKMKNLIIFNSITKDFVILIIFQIIYYNKSERL